MRDYKEIVSDMKKQPAINHTRGIVHFTPQHKRIFHKLQREHKWNKNNIRLLQHYIIANRMPLERAFKKVYNMRYM